jgi:hypothetical protein
MARLKRASRLPAKKDAANKDAKGKTKVMFFLIAAALSMYIISMAMVQKRVLDYSSTSASAAGYFDLLPTLKSVSPPVRNQNDEEHEMIEMLIAVDQFGACPEGCSFVHHYLPPWVRFKYISFDKEDMLEEHMKENAHLFILARTNIINLADLAVRWRETTNKTVGLWHMADERNYIGEIKKPYHKFDYVVRNYYRSGTDFYEQNGMFLRALGNMTCGESPPLPTNNALEPKYGVHYMMLTPHEWHSLLLDRHSAWPTSRRPINCSFQGRTDVKRSRGTRQRVKDVMDTNHSQMQCEVEFTKGFGLGATKWEYVTGALGQTKIGICPGGSNQETHRLTECLMVGTVPAVLDEHYLHVFFEEIPAIIGQTWEEVAVEMERLLNNMPELEDMSLRGLRFYNTLQNCMKSDLSTILEMAIGMENERLAPASVDLIELLTISSSRGEGTTSFGTVILCLSSVMLLVKLCSRFWIYQDSPQGRFRFVLRSHKQSCKS